MAASVDCSLPTTLSWSNEGVSWSRNSSVDETIDDVSTVYIEQGYPKTV